MMKLSSLSAALAAGVLLVGALAAQRARLPGLPMTPPPVPHPALARQPLIGGDALSNPLAVALAVKAAEAPKTDPATSGVKLKGRALERAVDRVKQMSWRDSYRECELNARSTGKPILWLQTLGDLTGFA